MFSKFKNLSVGVKASIIYTISSLLSKGLAVITVPIFTRIMSSEQIGVVNIFNSWQSMIATIASLSLTSGGYMVAMKEYSEKRDKYMSSVLTLTSMMALLIAVIYFLQPSFWNNLMGLPTALSVLMLISFFFSPATDFWLARQRYEYKYIAAGLVSMISAVIASVISVIAVVVASRNGVAELGEVRLFANGGVVYGVAAIFWLYIMLKGRTFVNKVYWKFSLSLSIPLIGNSIAMQVLSVSDRTMISKMVGNSAVGVYSVLYTVSSISLIVWSAINSSFIPFLFENIDKVGKEERIQKTSTELIAAYGLIAIAITLVAPEIVRILATKEYYDAIYIMPPIAGGIFLTSISNIYSNVLIYYKKTQYIMISSGIAAGLNLILNYVCIKQWGYMAAAYTTLVAYIVLALIQGIVAKRVFMSQDGNQSRSIYDTKRLFGISVFTIYGSLACLILYRNNVIRYSVIIALILLAIVFRKKLMAVLKIRR